MKPDDPSVLDILAGATPQWQLPRIFNGLHLWPELGPKSEGNAVSSWIELLQTWNYSAALIKLNQYLDEYPLDIRALQNKGSY